MAEISSDSQARAEEQQQELKSLVVALHSNNRQATLRDHEPSSTETGAPMIHASSSQAPSLSSRHPQKISTASSAGESRTSAENLNGTIFVELPFEKDLQASGVYRRVRRETMDFSFRSSVALTRGWSLYSGISLGQISHIAVLCQGAFSVGHWVRVYSGAGHYKGGLRPPLWDF